MSEREDWNTEKQTAVIDVGNLNTAYGRAGNDTPQDRVSSQVVEGSIPISSNSRELGESGLLVNDQVIDWDAMEEFLDVILKERLQLNLESSSILLSRSIFLPTNDRTRLCEIMMEKFGLEHLSMIQAAPLACYASGRTDAVYVHLGHQSTYSVVVNESYMVPGTIKTSSITAKRLNEELYEKLLQENSAKQSLLMTQFQFADFKQKCCSIRIRNDRLSLQREVSYHLPDGTIIQASPVIQYLHEAYFDPLMLSSDCKGIGEVVYSSIRDCHIDIRAVPMACNIILGGGNSYFSFLRERMTNDVREFAPNTVNVKVICPPDRSFDSWVGGSILSTIDVAKDLFISQQFYKEFGPELICEGKFLL